MTEFNFEPKIVAFLCNWCTYTGADLAGTSRIQYPPNVRIVRLMCSGSVDPTYVLKPLLDGADGVLIGGCHPGDCHYQSGNYKARRRIIALKEILKAVGFDEERVWPLDQRQRGRPFRRDGHPDDRRVKKERPQSYASGMGGIAERGGKAWKP